MLYGEVFADGIDPPCGNDPGQVPCRTGRWITPAVMSTYLLVANILLINLLIAVFNNIFNEVNSVSHQVWMFQRFTVVMEYEQKPVLPPPLIILCHIYLLLKYLKRKVRGERETYDNGLKLFLEKEDLERLYDFEEECVEGYFAEKEFKLLQSSDERIKVTTDRVENIVQKVEDINTKENSQIGTMQSLEFRLRKVEEVEEQILNQLAMIHRFMATRMVDELPEVKLVEERARKTSERSEGTSDNDSHLSVQPIRRRPTRSLTEVRPDAYIFDDGLHFEVRTLEEGDEDEESSISKPPPATSTAQRKLNVFAERQRSSESKTSITGSSERCEDSDISTEEITQLQLDVTRLTRPVGFRRDSSGRRSSEGGESERSNQYHSGLPRRQLSQTHSEPDSSEPCFHSFPERAVTVERSVTFAEPRITVIPPTASSASQSNARAAMLMAMHTEYTSITDELESVCGLLSPPRTPRLLSPPRPGQVNTHVPARRRNASEMSNPEMALYLEKEHLKDAEENDYMLMENLIKRQYEDDEYSINDQNPTLLSVVHETREFRNSPRSLRRSSAIEGDLPMPGDQLLLAASCSGAAAAAAGGSGMLSVPTITAEGHQAQCRQDSGDSVHTDSSSHDDTALLMSADQLPQRPSIVIDSSQLPTLQRELPKADSKASLHMQSETMC